MYLLPNKDQSKRQPNLNNQRFERKPTLLPFYSKTLLLYLFRFVFFFQIEDLEVNGEIESTKNIRKVKKKLKKSQKNKFFNSSNITTQK